MRQDDFYARLQRLSVRLRRRRFIGLLCLWTFAVSIALLAVAALEWVLVFREGTAFAISALIVGLGLVLFPLAHERLRRRQPLSPARLASLIERRRPEFLDTLKCAVDVAEGRIPHDSPLVPLLVTDVQERTSTLDFDREVDPPWARTRLLLLAGVLALAAAAASEHTRLVNKAWHGFLVTSGLGDSGIRLSPDDLRIARGRNLEVAIEVLRWERQADVVFRPSGGDWLRYPAVFEEGVKGVFTFYNVTGEIEFRVETPSLRSRTMRIEPFTPPRIDSAAILVTPPAYTMLEPQTLDALQDFEVAEGSLVTFEIATAAEQVYFRHNDQSTAVQQSAPGSFRQEITAVEDLRYSFRLRTADGLQSSSAPYLISVKPDSPPLVEIWNPGEDVAAPPDDIVPIEVYASDDYGLGEAHLFVSVSGEEKRIIPLSLQATSLPGEIGNVLEAQGIESLSLADLGAEDGDVIAYYAVVSDNREPTPQASRSDIFFIEARAEKPPIRMPGGIPMEQEGIELRAFIIELKRLIRLSYEAAEAAGSTRLERNLDVAAALGNLRGELTALRDAVAPDLQSTPLQPLLDWLNESLIQLQQSELLVNQNFTEEAIRFEEQALANLVRIENVLRLNVISETPSSGGEGQSESESPSTEPSSSQSESSGQQSGEPADLAALRQQIEQLVGRQNRLNAELERQASAPSDAAAMEQLAGRQEQLRAEALDIARQLAPTPGSEAARGELREARGRMSAGASAARGGDAGSAHLEGLRAREALLAAAAELDQMAAEALAAMIDQLGQNAESLAQAQGALASQSESAASGSASGEGLYEGQNELQSELESLLESIQSSAGALSQGMPGLGQAMSDAARQSERAGTGAAMTRAANALLYERFGRAGQLQREAEQGLEQLARDLEGLKAQLPPPGAEQLERLLAALERDRERLGEAASDSENDASSRENLREKWEQRLEDLSQSLDDRELGAISGQMSRLGTSGTASSSQLDALMADAGQALARQWARALKASQLQINRESSPPPDEYRSQVETYFRSLAEEP